MPHEELLERRHPVDRRHPKVARQLQRAEIVGEQAGKQVGDGDQRQVVEPAPALVPGQRFRTADVQSQPVGIDDDFIKQVREKVTPGTSALFALTSGATEDRVIEELKQFDFEIISTNLPADQEQRLREAFGEEPYVPEER